MRRCLYFLEKKAIKEINSGNESFFDRLLVDLSFKKLQEEGRFTVVEGYRKFFWDSIPTWEFDGIYSIAQNLRNSCCYLLNGA